MRLVFDGVRGQRTPELELRLSREYEPVTSRLLPLTALFASQATVRWHHDLPAFANTQTLKFWVEPPPSWLRNYGPMNPSSYPAEDPIDCDGSASDASDCGTLKNIPCPACPGISFLNASMLKYVRLFARAATDRKVTAGTSNLMQNHTDV